VTIIKSGIPQTTFIQSESEQEEGQIRREGRDKDSVERASLLLTAAVDS